MAVQELDRLALRLGIVNALASRVKGTAEKLADGAEEYERALAAETDRLRTHIGRVGVGNDPEAEKRYCTLLMQRHRVEQSYQLARRDAARMPDVAAKPMKKAMESVPLTPLPSVYLIAHAETEFNEGVDRMAGWIDVPISDMGRRQAREVGVALMPAGLEALVSSDLSRAAETAQIISEVLGVRCAGTNIGFRAWNLGDFQGQPPEVVGPEIRRYVLEHPDRKVPGGESFDAYHARFMAALAPILIFVGRNVQHSVGIVTHSRNLLLVQAWLRAGGKVGELDREFFCSRDVAPGAVLRLSLTPEGWLADLYPPVRMDTSPGEITMTNGEVLEKARHSKPMPGQTALDFDASKHPREPAGRHDHGYRPGEFVPKTVFHGTPHGDFGAFDLEKTSPGNRYGRGFYFTEHEDVAAQYPGTHPEVRRKDRRAHVYSARLHLTSPLDMAEAPPKGARSRVVRALRAFGVEPTPELERTKLASGEALFDAVRRAAPKDAIEKYGSTPEFARQVLERAGFDGLTHLSQSPRGDKLHRVWVAFRPDQVEVLGSRPVRKAVESVVQPFVPPDVPRWRKRPPEGEQRLLPLNGIENRGKFREVLAEMRAGEWTWDRPLIHVGDQLLTGSHRYHAAKEAGIPIPLKPFDDVCEEAGLDFETEWRKRAEPYGGWISNLCNVIRLLPPEIVKKYGIDLG